MRASDDFLKQLNQALDERRIREGSRLLDEFISTFSSLSGSSPQSPALALCAALWADVGYKEDGLITQLLALFPSTNRGKLTITEFLQLRLVEAYLAINQEDADSAISLCEFVLRAGTELPDSRVLMTAHFWKCRSHRKKGEYEQALLHIVEARRLAVELDAPKWEAVFQIQEGWLLFQKGQFKEAQLLLDSAEQELRDTDDQIALGNIASARGRIVRRSGEYEQALQHFDRAIAIFGEHRPSHRNLARTLINAAYVKRLIALQLRKRIDSQTRTTNQMPRALNGHSTVKSRNTYRTRHMQVCREALEQLRTAGEIYASLNHSTGTGSVLVNAGYLHLDSGDIDRAMSEAAKAFELASPHHDLILMARARILQASAENARVDEQLGEDADISIDANRARKYSEEAISLAQQTQNRRLLAAAFIVRGMTAANDFFQDWTEARAYLDRASGFLRSDDKDHLWEDWTELRTRVVRASSIDDTLRTWSEGIVQNNKTFQQISEEFAEIVISKVWLREDRKISRVVDRLSISPKKVRRILRKNGLLG